MPKEQRQQLFYDPFTRTNR